MMAVPRSLITFCILIGAASAPSDGAGLAAEDDALAGLLTAAATDGRDAERLRMLANRTVKEWRDTDGRTFRGELTFAGGNQATILPQDGTDEVTVPVEVLCVNDRRYVRVFELIFRDSCDRQVTRQELQQRRTLVHRATWLGPEAVGPLVRLLCSHRSSVARKALKALSVGRSGEFPGKPLTDPVIPRLLIELNSRRGAHRTRCLELLKTIGLPRIVALLNSTCLLKYYERTGADLVDFKSLIALAERHKGLQGTVPAPFVGFVTVFPPTTPERPGHAASVVSFIQILEQRAALQQLGVEEWFRRNWLPVVRDLFDRHDIKVTDSEIEELAHGGAIEEAYGVAASVAIAAIGSLGTAGASAVEAIEANREFADPELIDLIDEVLARIADEVEKE
jgi:hypothetical protein